MRLLIGYNGSDASNAALRGLPYIGFPKKSDIMLLTVAESWLPPKTLEQAEEVLSIGKAVLKHIVPDSAVIAEKVSGSPPREILARAESFRPDLIVVGELRKSEVGDPFLGNTSRSVLSEAQCSVRISREPNEGGDRPTRILVGFDGSAGAIDAIDTIVSRKWVNGVEVRLLVAADPSMLAAIGRFTPQIASATIQSKLTSQWADSLVAASVEKLRNANIACSVRMREGNAKDVIIHEAEKWNADTILVGPHCAPNSFERFLIGSVSSAVAARANCSVEVIRKI